MDVFECLLAPGVGLGDAGHVIDVLIGSHLENPRNAIWGLQCNIARAGQDQTLYPSQGRGPLMARAMCRTPLGQNVRGGLLDGFTTVWQALRAVEK